MKTLFSIFLCMGLCLTLNTQLSAQGKSGTLTIELTGFSNDKGKVMLALFDSEENFDNSGEPFRSAKAEIVDNKAEIIFKDLPFGTYAVSVFHDENGNEELDFHTFGFPIEPYGFSNNAWEQFGPAKWEKAQFVFDKDEISIEIAVKKYSM